MKKIALFTFFLIQVMAFSMKIAAQDKDSLPMCRCNEGGIVKHSEVTKFADSIVKKTLIKGGDTIFIFSENSYNQTKLFFLKISGSEISGKRYVLSKEMVELQPLNNMLLVTSMNLQPEFIDSLLKKYRLNREGFKTMISKPFLRFHFDSKFTVGYKTINYSEIYEVCYSQLVTEADDALSKMFFFLMQN